MERMGIGHDFLTLTWGMYCDPVYICHMWVGSPFRIVTSTAAPGRGVCCPLVKGLGRRVLSVSAKVRAERQKFYLCRAQLLIKPQIYKKIRDLNHLAASPSMPFLPQGTYL
ncbi:hypothetical protein NDU88_008988 [Pleurodeles waltl]|uniref:Uncharacterized protein n=1 Tax=Pleurodeles waltl TaxID=8319 RepID=A0AAV7PTQ8_PLEWA|nr:hypothetical protein NDU88_008988 [Pleurodeles waltl]